MQTYFDRIFPSFYAYLSMVLSGKGNDLKNLTSLDQSRLRIHTKQVKQFSVVEGFDSPLFHAFLREFKPIFQNTGRFLGPGRNTLSIQMVNIEKIKRHVLLSLVFRKRHQSATQLESVKPITIPAQTISRSDVLAFIRGERDPVVDYLEEVKRIEDEHRAQYYAKKEASKHGRVYRKFTGKELFLCMLSKITAEEFALAVLNITEIAMIEFDRQTKSPYTSHPSTAASPANRKQGAGKRQAIPVPEAAPTSGEQGTKVYGRNLSVMAMFMSRTTVADEVPDESARANANTRSSISQETSDNAASQEQFNGTGSTPASRQGREDTAEMKRMIQETARRVEAEALTQQRQELVQATRRNSVLTGALRRSSIMTGGMNPMAAAAAAAVNIVTGSVAISPTKEPATNSPSSTPTARPGRRLSQFNMGNSLGGPSNSQQLGSGMIPRKPEERRRSMNFTVQPGSTKAVESGFQSVGL